MPVPALRLRLVLSFFCLMTAAQLCAAISYPPPTFVTTGSQPNAIATADFNHDCAPDFATPNQGDNTVTVRYGNGSGGFPSSASYSGFMMPLSIVAADFNNDGSPDLAVGNNVNFSADPIGYAVSILLNDGTGTLVPLPVAASPVTNGMARWIATADLNEDGNADLLVSDTISTYGVRYYAGDGTGHFAAAVVLPTDTHPPAAMATAYLNADAHLDLAVAAGDALGIFLGNGDGTFAAPAYQLYPDPINGADGAVHVATADIDHDGDIDIATVAGNVAGGATVFRNNGNATFTRSQFKMPIQPANPVFVALADLDGDGNIDIVSANQSGCTPEGSNLSARAGNGDGTFGASNPISVGYGPTCLDQHWQPNAIAALDLNCDGAADMIVANMATSFVSVLLTAGAPDTTAPTITAPAATSVSADSGSCSATISNAQLGTATATDNCSGCVSITRSPSGNTFAAGTTIVTWTASDGHGNTAAATQSVTVTDGNPPVISAPADLAIVAGAGCVAASVDAGTPIASDECSSVTVTAARSDAQPLSAAYPLGATTITWTATDASGNSASAIQTITVTAPPPVISGGTASPAVLWPPNHKLANVLVSYGITGGCGSATCAITSVTSNEPVNGLGDGDVAPDWQLIDATHVKLRVERGGLGTGRVYTITITCSDTGGNTVTKNVTVSVPVAQN